MFLARAYPLRGNLQYDDGSASNKSWFKMKMNACTPFTEDVARVGMSERLATLANVDLDVESTTSENELIDAIDELVCLRRYNVLSAMERVVGPDAEFDVKDVVDKIVLAVGGDIDSIRNIVSATGASMAVQRALGEARSRGVLTKPTTTTQAELPCEWLSTWAPSMALLRLAAERGVVAAAMLGTAVRRSESFNESQARVLTGLWSDGSTSLLQLIASVFPDCVSASEVPMAARIDIARSDLELTTWRQIVSDSRAM